MPGGGIVGSNKTSGLQKGGPALTSANNPSSTVISDLENNLANNKIVYKLGQRKSGTKPRTSLQDFHQLREECLSKKVLFEDRDFSARISSVYLKKRCDRIMTSQMIEWKRPKEIVDDPQFVVDGFSRFDVKQGSVGDCWFLAALANLSLYPNLFCQVVPSDQGFGEGYAGIFHFRFWQCGKWVDVVIDDRLPTQDGELMFLKSNTTNEFWSSLLEKAYAKLYNCYDALDGGWIREASEDFTGGVAENFKIADASSGLFELLLCAHQRHSLMGCSIIEESQENAEAPKRIRGGEGKGNQGLITGHAYSVTNVLELDDVKLLRLRNPWGTDDEWTGPWSDKSDEWKSISDEKKKELGLTIEDDGEFWISFDDFESNFTHFEITYLDPASCLIEGATEKDKKNWILNTLDGEWVRGVTAGGNSDCSDSFYRNPQYVITLKEPDDDEEELCSVLVALMQKNPKTQKLRGEDLLTIGFDIHRIDKCEGVSKPLDKSFEKYCNTLVIESPYEGEREVSVRTKLPPGKYVIIPTASDADETAEFLLRVLSPKPNHLEEYDQKVGFGEVDERVLKRGKLLNKSEDQIRTYFEEQAGDKLEVNWEELKDVLEYSIELPEGALSKNAYRDSVIIMDADESGCIGYEEFKSVLNDIANLKAVFDFYVSDDSETLKTSNLRQALNSAGYRINNRSLNKFARRYGSDDDTITFEDLVLCALLVKKFIAKHGE